KRRLPRDFSSGSSGSNKHVTLLNALTDTVVRVDKNGVVMGLTASLRSPWLEVDAKQSGKTWLDLFPAELAIVIREKIDAALASGTSRRFSFRHLLPTESRRFQARVVLGRKDQVFLILRDITERSRLEYQIREIAEREQTSIGQDLHD